MSFCSSILFAQKFLPGIISVNESKKRGNFKFNRFDGFVLITSVIPQILKELLKLLMKLMI